MANASTARLIGAIVAARTAPFEKLVSIANLDPQKDFRTADLSGVNFGSVDLANFDLTGANLRGADLRRVRNYNLATLDNADLKGAKLPSADKLAALPSIAELARNEATTYWKRHLSTFQNEDARLQIAEALALDLMDAAKSPDWAKRTPWLPGLRPRNLPDVVHKIARTGLPVIIVIPEKDLFGLTESHFRNAKTVRNIRIDTGQIKTSVHLMPILDFQKITDMHYRSFFEAIRRRAKNGWVSAFVAIEEPFTSRAGDKIARRILNKRSGTADWHEFVRYFRNALKEYIADTNLGSSIFLIDER